MRRIDILLLRVLGLAVLPQSKYIRKKETVGECLRIGGFQLTSNFLGQNDLVYVQRYMFLSRVTLEEVHGDSTPRERDSRTELCFIANSLRSVDSV